VLERVSDVADAARIFWRIDDLAATSVFDALSGKAFELRAGVAAGGYTNALSHKYEYDLADNLARRTDAIKGITDSYKYDRLNRMTEYAVNSGEAAANRVVTMAYNAIGNVLAKSDVGGYGYGSRPHAVASAAGLGYEYDANGSIVEARAPGTSGAQGRVRQMTWTAFNQPQEMSYLGKTVAFTHDQDHQRIREVTTDGTKVRTLDLLHPDNKGGLAYEREETRVGGTLTLIENRHYISVGGAVVAVVKTSNDTAVISDAGRIQYWHKDALGSIVAVSDGAGQVIEQMAYDAWGKRVRASGMADPAVDPSNGDRGFTGHEHLDELQLVHMNGRVYDPLLGKFLSIDPVVGNPNDLQTYNRYSYVYNQPTRYADATGECPVCVFVFAVGAVMAMEGNKYWSVVGKIAMIWAAPQMIEAGLGNAATLQGMNAGAAAGATETVAASTFNAGNLGNSFLAASGSSLAGGSSLGDAVRDGAFAMAFTSVGAGFKGQTPQLLASHALLGCVQSAASGGKCGPGAMSAIIGKGTTLGLGAAGVTSPVAVGVVTIISGGTASVIGGGKFGNGAFQAGFGYVFNALTGRLVGQQLGGWAAGSACVGGGPLVAACAIGGRWLGGQIGNAVEDWIVLRVPSPFIPEDPYSPEEVSRRQTATRESEGAPNLDPNSRIPDRGPGKDMGGHEARGRTPHDTGERNVNSNEEHSRRTKGNPSGTPRR
jgi:RHS repeat-associated protein